MALEKTRKSLQEKEAQLRESEWQIQREREEKEKSIRELRTSLQTKEQLLEVRPTQHNTMLNISTGLQPMTQISV